MPTRQTFLRHRFAGGWATDFGPTSDVLAQELTPGIGRVDIPFLIDAENVVYEFDGGPHKMPGTTKLNSTVLESGSEIRGIFDYWKSGSSGSSVQKRLVYVNDSIYKDDADGSFSSLKSGLQHTKNANFSLFEDVVVIATDSTTDVPMSWDQSTFQNLAGSPPNFSFSAPHKNRLWAAGDASQPSRLYYSVLLDPEDWVGSGSGSIDIDPNDGDRITAIVSHKNELWVFKGPYRGSIHRIQGSSPTGSDAFARVPFIQGIGAVSPNAVFRFGDDIGFIAFDGSVHSLSATASYGDYNEVSLSRPINGWLRDHVNFSVLKGSWAATLNSSGYVVFTIPIDGSTTNNAILMMDFRFQPPRWAKWTALSAGCVAPVIDSASSNQQILMVGGNDGYVRKLGQPTRSIDGNAAISYTVTTPFLNYSDPIVKKTIAGGSIGFAPKNNGSVTFGWQRDTNAQQTQSVNQGGSSSTLGSFILDTDTLGGSSFSDQFFELEEGGDFRSIQYQVTNSTNNEDVEIHSLSAIVTRDDWSTEN